MVDGVSCAARGRLSDRTVSTPSLSMQSCWHSRGGSAAARRFVLDPNDMLGCVCHVTSLEQASAVA